MRGVFLFIWIFITAIVLLLTSIVKIRHNRERRSVSKTLSYLNKDKYKVINNAVLKLNEKTVHIDHIVVSEYGVFVIEVKNYLGCIIGEEKDEKWTEVLNNEKNSFNNPIIKSSRHIEFIKKALSDFGDVKIIPIIVFPWNTDIKVKSNVLIIPSSNLLKTITNFNENVMKDYEKERIYYNITSLNINNKQSIMHHIAVIEKKKQEKLNRVKKDICPKCGSMLVLKKGRYGYYKGCSNYPTCRFTGRV